MAIKITDINSDLPKLNKELIRFDQHQRQIRELQQEIVQLKNTVVAVRDLTNLNSTNSTTFTWTGGTLTVSWNDSIIHHGGHVHVVKAGSRVLTANVFYWAGWNPAQQTMSFDTNLQNIHGIRNVHILCQFFTGTGAQAGTLGGGGSEAGGFGISGTKYKLF